MLSTAHGPAQQPTTPSQAVARIWRAHETRAALRQARQRGVVSATIELATEACVRHGYDANGMRAWFEDARPRIAGLLADASVPVSVGDCGRVWISAVVEGSGTVRRAVFVYVTRILGGTFAATVDPTFDGVWS